MGQKVNPIGLRLGIVKDWESRWFSKKEYAELLHEDIKIREEIKNKFHHAGIARVEIDRASDRAKITIHTARPGIIIGRKGAEIETLRKSLEAMTKKRIFININEIRKPDLVAQFVAENVAAQLLRRISFRRALKKSVQTTLKMGGQGIRISCKGRLAGAEMARSEWSREGRVPLHTLRANIDFGFAVAHTKYGAIGIKVWIFLGEVFTQKGVAQNTVEAEA
ncbi:MAG TPA: 30S ribosomal protein S3 [Candidatus Sumerlaeota bacterium]|nr:MAG: 30S ribosomal protein S3 [candidate division BRC1 bacterium ADurb.Bin183]HOE64700.1 30S ribosomal protein S3 [Candidatus Sumerlaeota bacterium]HRR31612.1 30S ribosomal protein S3 [Candidatus Sumerlaeia bacterium]HON51427.1 30S ribosomal protein S3 [Candidatus Sumerlaeota bacterium]HOR64520.1 30S ribosomal protein S3 [Candidatus Sumerlaeota bacterium]